MQRTSLWKLEVVLERVLLFHGNGTYSVVLLEHQKEAVSSIEPTAREGAHPLISSTASEAYRGWAV